MSTSKNHSTPAWLVRTVASTTLVLSFILIGIVIINFSNLGTLVSIGIILGGIGSTYMSVMALLTANPAWVLLDIILPG